MRKPYRTISLPDDLYRRVEEVIKETGFRTPTEYILFALRFNLSQIEKERNRLISALSKKSSEKEINKIKSRLKKLGYLS